ncbi:MAG: hypothetical protein RR359_02850 [Bacilli bacterium]
MLKIAIEEFNKFCDSYGNVECKDCKYFETDDCDETKCFCVDKNYNRCKYYDYEYINDCMVEYIKDNYNIIITKK